MDKNLSAFKFIEVCPEVHRRGDIFEYPTSYVSRVKELMGTPTGRAFRSVFLYDQSYVDHFKATKSVAGFRGSFWAHEVIIDFDDNESIENARATTEKVARRLIYELGVDDKCIEIGFTGNRGFHISFPQSIIGFEPTPHLRAQMIGFLREVIKGCTSTTTKFDESIYKANGLIRISGSCHEKSGLYKIPLTVRDILDLKMGDIMAMAKDRRPRPPFLKPTEICPELAALWPKDGEEASRIIAKEQVKKMLPVLENGKRSADIRPDQRMCIQKMLNEDVRQGEGRNEIALRIASHHTVMSMPGTIVQAMMETWNSGLSQPLSAQELHRTVESAVATGYKHPCSDAYLMARCETKCFMYKDEVAPQSDEKHLKTVAQIGEVYINILKQNKFVSFGLDALDKCFRGTAPGEVTFEVGVSGIGKTTIMLQQAKNLRASTNRPILILEQELHDFLLYERLAALGVQKSSEDLEEFYKLSAKNNDFTEFNALLREVEERYDGIYFITLDQLNTKRKIELIRAAKKKYGDVAMVFEDYLGRGTEIGRDLYEITTRLAQGTKTAAKECDVPIISMVQARSGDGLDPSTPLDHNSFRDSRQVFIAADFCVAYWRPFFGLKGGQDSKIRGRTLKSRRSKEWQDFQLDWKRHTGEISTDFEYLSGVEGVEVVAGKDAAGGH